MAQTGRTRRRLTGLLLMTMTMMMTVQCSSSLGLVQVVGCMSHEQPRAAKIWNNRSSKPGRGSDWTCAGHRQTTLTLPCEQSLRLEVLSDLSEIGIRFRHRLARREGIEPYTHARPTNLLAFSFAPKQRWRGTGSCENRLIMLNKRKFPTVPSVSLPLPVLLRYCDKRPGRPDSLPISDGSYKDITRDHSIAVVRQYNRVTHQPMFQRSTQNCSTSPP